MSSPQVLDSAKIDTHREKAIDALQHETHRKAAEDALAKQRAVVEGMDGDYLTTDASAQLGRPLTRQQLISRLTKLNPNLIFEQSRNFPHIGAVYVSDPTANLTDSDPRCRGRRHIVGMEWTGLSPEFTTRKLSIDQWGKPQMTGQVRGWRTVLSRLIHEKLIGIAETERVFSIARGRESQRWFEEIN